MSISYSISGFPERSGYKMFCDDSFFNHVIVANSFNHAIDRFQNKFFRNFSSNWKFICSKSSSDYLDSDLFKVFYFDGYSSNFSFNDPLGQLIFKFPIN